MDSIILEEAGRLVQTREAWLGEARKAQSMAEELPKVILDYPIEACSLDYLTSRDELGLDVYFYGDKREERSREFLGLLVEAGMVLVPEELKGITFYSKPTSLKIDGVMDKVKISVHGLPLPPNCEIKEVDRPGRIYEVTCKGKGGD